MFQRARAFNSPKRRPTGFIVPCAPIRLDRVPSGPRWHHEIKYDGYRICASKGDTVRLWTRLQNECGGRFLRIAEAMAALPCESATIDGEAVVRRPDGHCDFHALRLKVGAAKAELIAFDLIELDGEDLRRMPIEDRRARLEPLCGGAIIFSEAIDAEGETVFAEACRMGLEGIVSKRKGSGYRSGRSNDWVKTLNPDYRRD